MHTFSELEHQARQVLHLHWLLRARHWHLFALTMGPALLGFVVVVVVVFDAPLELMAIAMVPATLGAQASTWIIGVRANELLPASSSKPTGLFTVVIVWSSLSILLDVFFNRSPLSSEMISATDQPWWLDLLHYVTTLYTVGFAARAIATCQLGGQATWGAIVRKVLLVWFYPVGVWFLQPFVNSRLNVSDMEVSTGGLTFERSSGHK